MSEADVAARLAALDVRKAAGDDGIPTKLLKAVAKEISPSLYYLFDLSLAKNGKKQPSLQCTRKKAHPLIQQTIVPSLSLVLFQKCWKALFMRIYTNK